MRGPAGGGEFEWGDQQLAGNLSEGTADGKEFEWGDQQLAVNLSGRTRRWWGI